MTPRLCRVVLPVGNVKKATDFYVTLLGVEGRRVSAGRHYFDCGNVVLALCDHKAEGDLAEARPNTEQLYFAVADLDDTFQRAKAAGCSWLEESIQIRPWCERSFYARDPYGNKLCFVDEATLFLGQ